LEMYLDFQGAAAAPEARETLSKCRRVLGDHDPITWEAMQACALCVSQAGATDECHRLLLELVDLTRPDPRAQTPQRLGRYLCNLAASLRDRGDYADASEALRQAILLVGAGSPNQILSHGWVVRELVESANLPEALPLLQEQISASLKADPAGTPTLCYRLEDLATLQLRRGNALAAGDAYSRAIDMSRALRGRADLNDQSRWRSRTLWCDPSFTRGWRSGALRDQLYCALDVLLHDYPPARLDPGEVRLAQLRFKLIPWGPTQPGNPARAGWPN